MPTGSRSGCVSALGAFDMVGNAEEWVADWMHLSESAACGSWTAPFATDKNCFIGVETASLGYAPGALLRGGGRSDGVAAGVFAIDGARRVSQSGMNWGFRCAR